MVALKMAYLSRSILTVLAWLFLVGPIIAVAYIFVSSGEFIEFQKLVIIGSLIAFSVASIAMFTGLSYNIINKRFNIRAEIYEKWGSSIGIKPLDKNNPNYTQNVLRAVRIDWLNNTTKPTVINIYGEKPMDVVALKELLEYLNSFAPRKRCYVFDLSELGSGELSAILSKEDDPRGKLMKVYIVLLGALKEVLPENVTPGIDFSVKFKNNPKVLDSFLLTRLTEHVNPKDYRAIEDRITTAIPPLNKDYWWRVEPISSTVLKVHQTKEKDPRNNEIVLKLLAKSATASLRFAGSYALVENIELYYVVNSVPVAFDIFFRNFDDLYDTPTVNKMATGIVRILYSKFGGEWQIINNINDGGRLSITKTA